MKVNKTIIIGLISIVIGGIILTSDILNPIIRPVTHLFLMGSSKGKDILFFGLLGLFLIIPQLIKKNYDSEKYLQISMGIGWLLLILGIALEVMFRQQMGRSRQRNGHQRGLSFSRYHYDYIFCY